MLDEVRNQHNKLLVATLLPTGLYKEMLSLQWRVVEAPEMLILPDCVAVGYEADEEYHPLMLCRSERLDSLICPISSRLALVGSRRDSWPPLVSFNAAAAECSHEFFVASDVTQPLSDLAVRISKRSHKIIDSAVDFATADFDTVEPEEELEYSPGIGVESADFSRSISIRLLNFGDEDLAKRLGDPLLALVSELAVDLPLGLIDGFTFAVDYDSALAELDRGIEGLLPLKSFDEWYGQGAIMSPIVVRDDRVKVHVVGRAELVLGLLSDDEEQRLLSVSTIAYALGHVAHVAILDKLAPRIWFGRFVDDYDRRRFETIEQAYSSYFSSRIVARILSSSYEDNLILLKNCLDTSKTSAFNALKAHDAAPDFGLLYTTLSAIAHSIIVFTSRVIGCLHGNQLDPERDFELMATMKTYALDKWIARFSSELAALWNAQGQQVGLSMYGAMLDHFDRIMLACGVFVWPGEEGLMIYPQRVSVPE